MTEIRGAPFESAPRILFRIIQIKKLCIELLAYAPFNPCFIHVILFSEIRPVGVLVLIPLPWADRTTDAA